MIDGKISGLSEPPRVTNEQLAEMPYLELLDLAEDRIRRLYDFDSSNVDEAQGLMMEICSFSAYIGFRPENENQQNRETLQRALSILKSIQDAMRHIEEAILEAYQQYIPNLTIAQMKEPLVLSDLKDKGSSLYAKWNALNFPRDSEEHRKYLIWSLMVEDTLRNLSLPSRLPFRIRAIESLIEELG